MDGAEAGADGRGVGVVVVQLRRVMLETPGEMEAALARLQVQPPPHLLLMTTTTVLSRLPGGGGGGPWQSKARRRGCCLPASCGR